MDKKVKFSGRTRCLIALALAGTLTTTAVLTRADDVKPTPAPSQSGILYGISRPSKEAKLSFPAPGIVTELKVEPGDHVTAGQLLAGQDDREDQIALKAFRREAESMAKVDYSKADKALKIIKRDRTKTLFDKKIASPSEMEDAIQAVSLAQAQIELAEIEHDKSGFDVQKEQTKIERMHLTAPFDGVVRKLNIEVGEMADPQNREGSVVIAKLDPLRIEIKPDVEDARKLKLGQELEVQYDGADKQLKAKVYFMDQVDAASGTQEIWLSMPNPDLNPAGLRLIVRMPAK